ncbi:hypothetical protein [Streptomyces sp. IMTB 2501]|uniref:hypothetical protein n=1 Tax=Streptomyces sp. IMTB 2501 TaxID=1776340 RepID=UPI0021162CA9|nr:hypothetical protein [Streptomyces sp. IMTB 2501]
MSGGAGEGGAAPAAVLDNDGGGVSYGVFEQVGAVADAVLYEGYLLYPYRRSSPKNRVRWQFGVLLPRDWVERDGPVTPGISGSADSWYQRTECLFRASRADAVVRVRVRYLQMQDKQVQSVDEGGRFRAVESLRTADGAAHLSFEEAVPRETELVLSLAELVRGGRTAPVGAAAGAESEPLPDGAGRTVRRRRAVRATATVAAEQLAPDLYRLRVRTENTGEATDPQAPRDEALRQALIATHTLVGGDGVEFASLIDPPGELARHARGCRNAFTFPVLCGAPEERATGSVMLSAPIILPDRPQVAPESPGDLHDAAEIDEILTLRTMLLTDEEKAEARATDPRAARIVDRVDTMPREVFERLHGAIRSLTPVAPRESARPAWWQEGGDEGLSPTDDTVLVAGVSVGAGSPVRLRPHPRGADAQDMFLDGRTATVAAVFHDVDGSVRLAVTVDDDPAAELHGWYGRFHYFRPDEVEPLAPPGAPAPAGQAHDRLRRRPQT